MNLLDTIKQAIQSSATGAPQPQPPTPETQPTLSAAPHSPRARNPIMNLLDFDANNDGTKDFKGFLIAIGTALGAYWLGSMAMGKLSKTPRRQAAPWARPARPRRATSYRARAKRYTRRRSYGRRRARWS
jgi:hypothetical protein